MLNILWVEDETYVIRGLMRGLQKRGDRVDVARSAYEGYQRIRQKKYDLIVVDLIIPLYEDDNDEQVTQQWTIEKYPGVGLIKSFRNLLHLKCPILIVSIVQGPILRFGLKDFANGELNKIDLEPEQVVAKVDEIMQTSQPA